jgi:hypothetical protein
MSEGKLVNVFCWKPEPGLQWRCYEGVSGITVDAESKEAAVDHFNSIWNFRTPVQWIFEAPPRPKGRDDPKPVSAAIEGETDAVKFHRLVLRAFHPDLHGAKKRWSANEITVTLSDCWERANAK